MIQQELLNERGKLCEWCHNYKWTDLHHGIIHRMEGHPELDCKENFMCVCRKCHSSGDLDSKKFKVKFWKTQCVRYGKEHMENWLSGLSLKIKLLPPSE